MTQDPVDPFDSSHNQLWTGCPNCGSAEHTPDADPFGVEYCDECGEPLYKGSVMFAERIRDELVEDEVLRRGEQWIRENFD